MVGNLVFCCLIIFRPAYGENSNIWVHFIEHPDHDRFIECKQQIEDSLTGDYKVNIYGERIETPTQTQLIKNMELFNQFLSLIRRGNIYALELGIQIRQLTNGGAKEDLDVSIGNNITKIPTIFLGLAKRYAIYKQDDFYSVLVNYGDEFVDKLDKQIVQTDLRIKALNRVRDADVFEIKQKCIAILQKQKRLLSIKVIEMRKRNQKIERK